MKEEETEQKEKEKYPKIRRRNEDFKKVTRKSIFDW